MKVARLGLLAVLCTACPKKETVQAGACESCHQPDGQIGIEQPHPYYAVRCHECHGGDPSVQTVAGSHVTNPLNDNIRNLPLDALRSEELALYRRFVNPGDLIAVRQTCGADNAQAGSTGCHQGIVESSLRSIHATAGGLTNIPRFAAGLRESDRFFSPVAVTHEGFSSSSAPDDAVETMEAISLPDLSNATPQQPRPYLEHALSKACSGCHLHIYGLVDYGSGRQGSSGCSTCHSVYATDARSQSSDPVIDHGEQGHPAKHMVERYPPQSTCEGCHFRSTRIGMHFKGVREETIDDRRFGLPHAVRIEEELHGKPAGFFVLDDDSRDSLDVTPPDIHGARGMICVDCHGAQDMHGTGHIRGGMGFETGIECSDCHGTFDDDAGEDGTFTTSGGAPLPQLRRQGDSVILTGRDGRDRLVSQLSQLKVQLASEEIDAAHSDGNHGELECYACHTAWMQNVYGLRMTLDLRHQSRDPITGEETPGIVVEENELVSLENLHLGINTDGKIGPFMAYSILFDVVEPCQPGNDPECTNNPPDELIYGKRVVRRFTPLSADQQTGLTFTPVFPHTTATRSTVQPCERCHPRQWEVDPGRIGEDDRRVRATYGQGTGVFSVSLSGSSTTAPMDLTRFADERGQAVVGFSQPGVGPLPASRVMRPLSYRVPPTLR